MKKRLIIPAIGASAVLGYMLMNKENKNEKTKQHSTLEDAGIPDQTEFIDDAQLENAKMVSEGSQFGVHYYNEAVEESKDLS